MVTVEQEVVRGLSNIIQKAVKPSIGALKTDEELKAFLDKLSKVPRLILEKPIQKEAVELLEQRKVKDKHILAKRTADVARLISLMSVYINDAININQKGSSNVSDITNEIESISIAKNSNNDLTKLQDKLLQAAKDIQKEMDIINNNFEENKDTIAKLEKKVQKLEAELKKTKQENTKDHLTGVLNRKAYENELEKLEDKYKRLKQDFAVVFFDLDYFKKINDTYGHSTGDIVLKHFATLLKKLTRHSDIIGRYGGEEFVVVISYNKYDELIGYAKRIKNIVNSNKFICGEHKIELTFSAGIELRSNCDTLETTIKNADKLLYLAKSTGRDKIILWNKEEL
jgi:diguanylate cyclase (GGDEF)-like protein